MPLGAVTQAMGNTGVALGKNVSALFWNPSVIAFSDSFTCSIEGARLYNGLSHHAGAFLSVPLREQVNTALLYSGFFSGPIKKYSPLQGSFPERIADEDLRANGSYDGVFVNNHHIVILTFAKDYRLRFSRTAGIAIPRPILLGFGVNVKFYGQTMNPDNIQHVGMNLNMDAGCVLRIGVDYDLKENEIARALNIGLSMKNIVPSDMIWLDSEDEYTEEVDPSFYFGVSFDDHRGIRDIITYTVALSYHREMVEKNDFENGARIVYGNSYHGGLEIVLLKKVFIRAGVSDKIPVLGAGIRFGKIKIDYSFSFDEIDYSPVRLALSAIF